MIDEKPIIFLGAGGHASVLAEILNLRDRTILGIIAPTSSQLKNYLNIPYLGTDQDIEKYSPRDVRLVNALGSLSVSDNRKREQLFLRLKEKGYFFDTVIHPNALISKNAVINEGVHLMAGVIIQANSIISQNTIINTRASIDHDCSVGPNVHVAPGVIMSGNVNISKNAFIGVGSVIIQNIKIAESTMVKAGSVIIKDVLTELHAS